MSDRKSDIPNGPVEITAAPSIIGSDSTWRSPERAVAAAPESGPEAAGDSSFDAQDFPLRVPSLTNSPGCVPGFRKPRAARLGQTRTTHMTHTARSTAPRRHVRAVRVDAWATPASTSWTRTRRTVRKVSRQPQSTNWALPF